MFCTTAFSAGAFLWVVGASHFRHLQQQPLVSVNRMEGTPFLKLGLATHLNALDCSLKVTFPLFSQETLGDRAPNVGTLGREWESSPEGAPNMEHLTFC